MPSFEELRSKAKDLARGGVAKAKEVGDIAKLNMAIVSEEEAIKKCYVEIGKLYYAEHSMAPDEAYVGLCNRIVESKAVVEENKAKIAKIKEENPDCVEGCVCDCTAEDEAE